MPHSARSAGLVGVAVEAVPCEAAEHERGRVRDLAVRGHDQLRRPARSSAPSPSRSCRHRCAHADRASRILARGGVDDDQAPRPRVMWCGRHARRVHDAQSSTGRRYRFGQERPDRTSGGDERGTTARSSRELHEPAPAPSAVRATPVATASSRIRVSVTTTAHAESPRLRRDLGSIDASMTWPAPGRGRRGPRRRTTPRCRASAIIVSAGPFTAAPPMRSLMRDDVLLCRGDRTSSTPGTARIGPIDRIGFAGHTTMASALCEASSTPGAGTRRRRCRRTAPRSPAAPSRSRTNHSCMARSRVALGHAAVMRVATRSSVIGSSRHSRPQAVAMSRGHLGERRARCAVVPVR